MESQWFSHLYGMLLCSDHKDDTIAFLKQKVVKKNKAPMSEVGSNRRV